MICEYSVHPFMRQLTVYMRPKNPVQVNDQGRDHESLTLPKWALEQINIAWNQQEIEGR